MVYPRRVWSRGHTGPTRIPTRGPAAGPRDGVELVEEQNRGHSGRPKRLLPLPFRLTNALQSQHIARKTGCVVNSSKALLPGPVAGLEALKSNKIAGWTTPVACTLQKGSGQHAGGGLPGLVKQVAHIRLALAKPHGEQLWPLRPRKAFCGKALWWEMPNPYPPIPLSPFPGPPPPQTL